MKLETYLLLKTVISGIGVIGAIAWVWYIVHEEVKWKDKQYKKK